MKNMFGLHKSKLMVGFGDEVTMHCPGQCINAKLESTGNLNLQQ